MTMNDHVKGIYRYIMLNTSHLSQADALTLSYLSDPIESESTRTHEWIHNTGMHNGFLIQLAASDDAPGELRARGVSEALCNTLALLARTFNLSMIHFDSEADVLAGIPVYEW